MLISRPANTDGTPAGVAVVFDASDIVGADLVAASAVISSSDGVTERVHVKRVQSFRDDHDSTSQRLGLAVLARTVPAPTGSEISMDGNLQGFRNALHRNGIHLSVAGVREGGAAEGARRSRSLTRWARSPRPRVRHRGRVRSRASPTTCPTPTRWSVASGTPSAR